MLLLYNVVGLTTVTKSISSTTAVAAAPIKITKSGWVHMATQNTIVAEVTISIETTESGGMHITT